MRISDWSSDVCSSDLPPATCPPAPSPTNTNTRNRVMAVKIEKKITGYAVVGADDKDKAAAATPVAREAAESELPTAEVIHMHERIERPEVLVGSPYQLGRAHVRTPVTHAHLVCRRLLEKTKT